MITYIRKEDVDKVSQLKAQNYTWEEVFKQMDLSKELQDYHKKRYELTLEYMGGKNE